jgi:2'-phosphotransferase
MRKYRSMNLTLPLLRTIVADNDKQRFTITPLTADSDPHDPRQHLIRANQGHSIALSAEALDLEPLSPDHPEFPEKLVHGTFYPGYEGIVASGGLKRMARMHIHLSPFKKWQAGGVISGMRKDAEAIVVVDARRANGKMKFWRSVNGVVLTEGDEHGVLGLEFVEKVVDLKNDLGTLWENGKVTRELPEELRGRQAPRGKGPAQGKKNQTRAERPGSNEKGEGGPKFGKDVRRKRANGKEESIESAAKAGTSESRAEELERVRSLNIAASRA